MKLPYGLPPAFVAQAGTSEEWASYLRRLPRLADELTDEWDLAYDGSPAYGRSGLVLPVLTREGQQGMLKIGFPHADGTGEPLALQLWGGRGAVELWRADPRRSALLLERLDPEDLTGVDVLEACDVVGGLYGLLHRPPTPRLTDLRTLVAGWLEDLRALPRDAVPGRFVEQALAAAPRLLA
ncbi:MAG TPA: aminoglycoside phosphotransferase family protein, partial [Propionibacteriaceae bacterium]|nr:aminoglycoside phosphotransferase family protein [Propionibacteriaceae bacterium]